MPLTAAQKAAIIIPQYSALYPSTRHLTRLLSRGKVGRRSYGLLFVYTVHDDAAKSLYIKAINPVQYFHIPGAGDRSEQRKIIDKQIKAASMIISTSLAWERMTGMIGTPSKQTVYYS